MGSGVRRTFARAFRGTPRSADCGLVSYSLPVQTIGICALFQTARSVPDARIAGSVANARHSVSERLFYRANMTQVGKKRRWATPVKTVGVLTTFGEITWPPCVDSRAR